MQRGFGPPATKRRTHAYLPHRRDAGYDSSSILRNIDLEVREGEVVALLGRNGAGKTRFCVP